MVSIEVGGVRSTLRVHIEKQLGLLGDELEVAPFGATNRPSGSIDRGVEHVGHLRRDLQ